MAELRKPDWIPLYLQRAKASDTWDLPDYQFGWFWKLIFNLADSDKPGYLPNDDNDLWRLAGARSHRFFAEKGGRDLLRRHFRSTDDGLWIYNQRLLEVLREQKEKQVKRGPPSLLSVVDDSKSKATSVSKGEEISPERARALFAEIEQRGAAARQKREQKLPRVEMQVVELAKPEDWAEFRGKLKAVIDGSKMP